MLLDDFARQATQNPLGLAILDQSHTASYGELWSQSGHIAAELRRLGITSGDRVALCLPKDTQAIACVLGVLRASATYVPIDPRTPAARAGQILEICSPRLLIASRSHLDRFGGNPAVNRPGMGVILPEQLLAPATCPQPLGPIEVSVDAEAAAYILYTSGSTGIPKGVVVSHEAASAFVHWACDTFELNPSDRLTSFAPLSFDLSIFDIFAALSSGASSVIISPELLLRPLELAEKLQNWAPTTIYAVPSTINLLVQAGKLRQAAMPNLRRVLYAGEPFPMPQLLEAMAALPNAAFFNLFGPTETNVCTYHHLTARPDPDQTQVPIGRACEHLTVDVLDDAARAVAVGEEGELCVAGPSVMTGYFGNPEATRSVFHPGHCFPDGRARYRTGDLARLDALGQFWFLGRRDRLVKRRGYRIELGEIEMALLRHPAILEAVVATESHGDDMCIVAFVTLRPRHQVGTLILRTHCGSLLLPYMVPDTIRIVPSMPRTLTGKVDLMQLQNDETQP